MKIFPRYHLAASRTRSVKQTAAGEALEPLGLSAQPASSCLPWEQNLLGSPGQLWPGPGWSVTLRGVTETGGHQGRLLQLTDRGDQGDGGAQERQGQVGGVTTSHGA